jgi:hypothetical protein
VVAGCGIFVRDVYDPQSPEELRQLSRQNKKGPANLPAPDF